MKNKSSYKTYYRKLAVVLVFLLGILQSCSDDDEDSLERGNWISRSVFDGTPRSSSVSFVINGKGYMGTGFDGDDYLNDFWEYNMDGNYWVQKASFPGLARSSAVGFANSTKGYLGTGYDSDTGNELSDFWEYNPNTNTWIQKADFGGGNRREAVSFSANENGYIGTGFDGENDRKDFWKYDPTLDEWTEILGYGGSKRRGATTFKVNEKVYLLTGVSNGLYVEDFWEFNAISEEWIKKKDIDYEDDYNIIRSDAVGFSINNKGYVSCGYNQGALGTIWEYDPTLDFWERLSSLEATPRQDPISFSDNNRAFVLLGRTGGLYLDDNYEFKPNELYNEDD